jgi:hypothetical protein
MCLTKKSRKFVIDYAKDTPVTTVDGAKNPNYLAHIVVKLFQKNTWGQLNPK